MRVNRTVRGRSGGSGSTPDPASAARRDLVLLVLLVLASLVLSIVFDPVDRLMQWAGRHGNRHIDELFMVTLVLSVGLALFGFQRLREIRQGRSRLIESEERYRVLFERNPHAMWVFDTETLAFLAVNDAAVKRYGYSREEFLERSAPAIEASGGRSSLDRTTTQVEAAMAGGVRNHRTKDGSVIEVDLTSQEITFDGRRAGLVLAHDLTEIDKAHEALRESEERFKSLFEDAVVGQTVTAPDGTFLQVNRAFCEMFGYTEEELLRSDFMGVTVPEDREISWEWYQKLLRGEVGHYHLEKRYRRKDGQILDVRLSASLIRDASGEPRYGLGLVQDVTAQRAAERLLREAEARYRALVEQIQAILYIDLPGEAMTSIYVSPQIEAILGVTADRYLADPSMWESMLHPEDRERTVGQYFEYLRRISESTEPITDEDEYRMIRPDGRTVWIYDQSTVLRDEEGNPALIQGVMFDITERKEAHESIRKSEATLRATMESTADGILVVDTEGALVVANWRFAEMWGIPESLMQTHSDDALLAFVLDQLKEPEQFLLKVRELYRSDQEDFDTLLFKDGRVFERYSRPLIDGGEIGGRVWSFRDVTEREEAGRHLQEAYDQEREAAQQLRALNEMKNTFLSAVSHELRTPLSAVLGLALTLQREDMALPPQESRELLDRLAVNARKLERLLADLLDLDRLSRGIVEPRRRLTDIGALVRGALEGSDLFGRRSIQVEAESVVIPVDAPKVERIVENLLANAARHTPAGTRVAVRVAASDDGVLIAVDDSGPGVPEDIRERIFEPFQQGPGTPSYSPGVGIGLSLVARFAELHGGRAWVEERPGGGASFRVFLPGESGAEPDGDGGDGWAAGRDGAGETSGAREGRR